MGLQKHPDPRYSPYAFTENGAIMAANVLNSPEAVRMSVFVARAFMKMRDLLGGTKEHTSGNHDPPFRRFSLSATSLFGRVLPCL